MLKCRGVGEERDNWDPQGGKDSLVTSSQVGQGFLYKILDSKNMGLYLEATGVPYVFFVVKKTVI